MANTDLIEGATRQVTGGVKEGIGSLLGDKQIEAEGTAERTGGQVQRVFGDLIDSVEGGVQPLIDGLRRFVRERPFTAALTAGVVGLAVLNSLRGRR